MAWADFYIFNRISVVSVLLFRSNRRKCILIWWLPNRFNLAIVVALAWQPKKCCWVFFISLNAMADRCSSTYTLWKVTWTAQPALRWLPEREKQCSINCPLKRFAFLLNTRITLIFEWNTTNVYSEKVNRIRKRKGATKAY